ncbi:hypothetical protein GCM10023235_08130 [Kitasatospora terrestris]|uniref:Uncharacterized protein n=1 Tax=Kitasatospora terrestris TaxID=258051 RepID=A0ABP9D9B0_9ACTN
MSPLVALGSPRTASRRPKAGALLQENGRQAFGLTCDIATLGSPDLLPVASRDSPQFPGPTWQDCGTASPMYSAPSLHRLAAAPHSSAPVVEGTSPFEQGHGANRQQPDDTAHGEMASLSRMGSEELRHLGNQRKSQVTQLEYVGLTKAAPESLVLKAFSASISATGGAFGP